MKLAAPKFGTWLAAVILGALGALIHFGILEMSISFIALDLGFWLLFVALIMMVLSTLVRGI